MRHGTPFFQGFSSILFGRPALSGVQKTLRQVAALNTLSDCFETFGFLIPDALLSRRSSGTNSRQRRFTLHVTFWAFLAQTLAPETSCREIVRKVQAWWLLRAPKSNAGSSSCAAYTKARQRLEPETIRCTMRIFTGATLLAGLLRAMALGLANSSRVIDDPFALASAVTDSGWDVLLISGDAQRRRLRFRCRSPSPHRLHDPL